MRIITTMIWSFTTELPNAVRISFEAKNSAFSGSTTTKTILDVLSEHLDFHLLDSPIGRPNSKNFGNVTIDGHHITPDGFRQLIARFRKKDKSKGLLYIT